MVLSLDLVSERTEDFLRNWNLPDCILSWKFLSQREKAFSTLET
jgi:hypothetical protein